MKRLTDKRLALPPGVWQEVTREQRIELQEIPVPSKQELYYRLFEIEEILCDSVGDNDPDGEDEYDLDRLTVMCNQRMTMRDEVSARFSLTAKMPLDRLRELVELYNNVPHICDYCIGCEIEPTDGHGCDGYDNFVFSVRRIVAALKAREQDE